MTGNANGSRFWSPPLAEAECADGAQDDVVIRCAKLFDKILPAEWEIYVRPYLNGLKPDLVLLNPQVGVGVFHVVPNLGSAEHGVGLWLSSNPEDGTGVKVRDTYSRSRQRGQLCKKEILEFYLPGCNAYGPSNFAYAAVSSGLIFSDLSERQVEQLTLEMYSDYSRSMVRHYEPHISRDALESEDLTKLFPEGCRQSSKLMTPRAAQNIRTWLLAPEYRREKLRPLVLDDKQREISQRRSQSGYQRIRGPAGSGKTTVLAAKAACLEAVGKRCLILVYNLTLVNYIRDLVDRARLDWPGSSQSIEIMSFHAWCRRVCHESGFQDQYKAVWARALGSEDEHAKESVFQEEMARLVGSILSRFQPDCQTPIEAASFDAILVDEGQDFHPSWWDCSRKALSRDGEMVLFADMAQDIYQTAKRWTNEAMVGAGFRGPWTELRVAHRLPPMLIPFVRDFAAQFMPESLPDIPESRQHELLLDRDIHLRWHQVSESQVAAAASEAVLGMPEASMLADVSYSDVVVIADECSTGMAVVGALQRRRVRVFHTLQSDSHENRAAKMEFFLSDCRVKATTIHSFKGLESRFIVICLTRAKKPRELAALYTALTRLKASEFGDSYLTVVCAEPKLREYGQTWPEHSSAEGWAAAS